MSVLFKIEKEKLKGIVDLLISKHDLFGPSRTNGLVTFAKIKSSDELELDVFNTDKSAKDMFFPQTDMMFSYKNNEITNPSTRKKPIAVFGIRPCDTKSLLVLNRVFDSGEYQDFYWNRLYGDALVFTIGCNKPLSTCFCNWLDLGPFSKQGSDIFLSDIGKAFLVESCSEKGERFLKTLPEIDLQKPTQDDIEKAALIKENAESSMSKKTDVAGLKTILEKLWDSELWDELSYKCLSCGACTYLCPTCHCFDVQDERIPGTDQGRRIRIWDSCMFSLFTKEASGHNPRPTTRERMRQRMMHKFCYFVEDFGEIACVGCGRCIRSCPVNHDIREAIKRISNEG